MAHTTVLLKEAIDGLDLKPGDVFLDTTLGDGGHSFEVWTRFGPKVVLSGIDADGDSVARSRERLEKVGAKPNFGVLNFNDLEKVSEVLGTPKPNKILFDLGWSTTQFEESKRGFSFKVDEPLVMTFKKDLTEEDTTAYDVVNTWSEDSLLSILYGFGEEQNARKIVSAILKNREETPITTSKELAEVIYEAVPMWYRFKRIHPATKTFQAIRMAVNNELIILQNGVTKAWNLVPPGGRVAVISFHSLEDRMIKNLFREFMAGEVATLINKKPITPLGDELMANPRARSAKLRIIEKTKEF